MQASRELNGRYKHAQNDGKSKNGSVIDLALKSYLAENPIPSVKDKATSRKGFEGFAMAQFKFFTFAGHDTTSTGAIFTLLPKNPASLASLRAQNGAVFSDVGSVASVLGSKPQLLSQLPFTLAVIKVSLLLHPTAAALRAGQSDFSLAGPTGQQFPESWLVWGDHQGVQHNPKHWSQPEARC